MARFRTQEAFQAKEYAPVQLLPFHFERISDNKVILTNFAGEHYFCSQETLEQLASGDIKYGSKEYKDLRSLHFFTDSQTSIAPKLLGIKYRTRLSRIAELTSLHMFVVTLRCEHSCPYCQVSRQSDDKLSFDMSQPHASKAIDFALSSPSKKLKFEFQGGESLLNFDLIRFIVEETKSRSEGLEKDVSFVIATNLAVLTDEILEFCKLQNISISTSLDGPRELHNFNRPRPGKDSYERTISGIRRARLKLGFDKVSALMTTTEKSLSSPKEIVDEYIANDFSGIFLRPLSPYGFAIKTKKFNAYDEQKWFEFYQKGLDYILEINRSGHYFSEYYSATILKKILTFTDPGYVDLRSPAGIGIGGIVYNYDGKIFASDEGRMLAEMGDTTFEIGNLDDHNYTQVIGSEKLLDPIVESVALSAPRCHSCAFQNYCGAEPVFHYATAGDFLGHKGESAFCYRNMNTIKYLFEKLETKEYGDILRSWI